MDIFFSNRLEVLYECLKHSLFSASAMPLMRRLVVVYGPAMKTWLMLRMAQDPNLQVAAGMECLYLNQAFDHLLKLSGSGGIGHLPTPMELAFAIERECLAAVRHFPHLPEDERRDWKPLIHYLKLTPPHLDLSLKAERRLVSLSQHLARLFQDYGRYAGHMVAEWESPECAGWQPRLWRKLFGEATGWSYPIRALQKGGVPSIPFTLHIFSISFITASEFTFLHRLSGSLLVHYYALSPCAVFWSDIRSDKESAYLQAFWQKKEGRASPQVLQLEEFLRDRNPLLANFGRLGREMALQIEESQAQTHAHYLLPETAQMLELDTHEDLEFTSASLPLSLLHAVQADLLTMRNPQGLPPVDLEERQSLQLHVAPNPGREVQILYHNLLALIAQDPSLCPGDIIVMAPQIAGYVPYIHSFFGAEGSQLDFQILDLGMQAHSDIVQGFLQLLELSESRWDAGRLLQLFEHSSFQRRHQLTSGDCVAIRHWIAQAGICWGDDEPHRNELLEKRHCQRGMAEETAVGTWDYGLSRLLFGLTTVAEARTGEPFEVPPCPAIDFSQGELLGKWIRVLQALRDDLSPFNDRTHLTIGDWADYFACLLENYFLPDFESAASIDEYGDLKAQLEVLKGAARFFETTSFSFASIKSHLITLLQHRGLTHREEHLQAVRFCSLVPLRSIPARVIAILGLQEGEFPRPAHRSSLNLMPSQERGGYCPLPADYDRYLFLEILHSARDYLLLSYPGYGRHDSKELQPSLVVEELFSYLDSFYTIQSKKISETCIHRHPFDPFDRRYFQQEGCLHNFSLHDHRVAQIQGSQTKSPPHRFFTDFTCASASLPDLLENHSRIDLQHLTSVARHPIKFYLNKVLEIYLQSEEERALKVEEDLLLSSLDKYWLKHFAVTEPLDQVLYRAEKEGKLPFGLFKTVATKRLREEVEETYERLRKQKVEIPSIFQIECCTSCSSPVQIEEKRWLFPAASLHYEGGYTLSVTGKLTHVASKGLIVLGKNTLADTWKAWPQFLLYCHAARLSPHLLEPRLILAHSNESKMAFFDNPEPLLKRFIDYYALCLKNISPLLPDWIPFLLEGDAQGLEAKMQQAFLEPFGAYQDRDLRWILNPRCLPEVHTLIAHWRPHAELLAGDLSRYWF